MCQWFAGPQPGSFGKGLQISLSAPAAQSPSRPDQLPGPGPARGVKHDSDFSESTGYAGEPESRSPGLVALNFEPVKLGPNMARTRAQVEA